MLALLTLGKGMKKGRGKAADGGKVNSPPTKAEQLQNNRELGQHREDFYEDGLTKRLGDDYTIHKQRTLYNADGTRAIDPKTGQGRRVDFIIERKGKAIGSREITSKKANKRSQQSKEGRIRDNGGYYYKDSNGNLKSLETIPTRVKRY